MDFPRIWENSMHEIWRIWVTITSTIDQVLRMNSVQEPIPTPLERFRDVKLSGKLFAIKEFQILENHSLPTLLDPASRTG